MKKLTLLFFFLAFGIAYYGMINPFYKEVMQRGYEILPGDSVKFPDGSICSIASFNDGQCGEQWMTSDYCVPEGEPIWDNDRCCEGLEPYLEDGVDGHQTCQKIQENSFFSSNTVLYFFIGVLIPLGLFVILAVSVKKRLPKKEE